MEEVVVVLFLAALIVMLVLGIRVQTGPNDRRQKQRTPAGRAPVHGTAKPPQRTGLSTNFRAKARSLADNKSKGAS